MPRTVRKCPACSSTNIAFWIGAASGIIYKCNDCGYVGPLIIEEDVEQKKNGKKDSHPV